MIEPTSAVPVTALSPSLTSFTTGAAGASLSSAFATVASVAPDLLPAASVAVTETLSPSFKPLTGMLKVPSSPAVAVAFVPFGRVTSTVEPASAVPVTAVSPALTSFTFGASGAVLSSAFATVASVAPDLLPAASVAVTETLSPSFKPLTGMLKVPSSPAVAVAFVPFGRVTSTVEPASAVPVTAVSPALTGFTTGAVGASLSSALTTVCAGVNVAVEPSGNVTVADPSFPTSTLVAVGLASSTAFLTASFSG